MSGSAVPARPASAGRRRFTLLLLLGLTLVSFGLRAGSLDAQSIWRDEADSLRFAGSPAQIREMFTLPGHNAPLYYLLLRGWMVLAGDGILAARAFSVLCGLIAVVALYAIGRRLGGERIAWLTAGLAAVSPYLVWYSQEARTYAPLLATVLIALALLLAALQDGGRLHWAGFVAAAGVSLYLHVTAGLMLPVYALAIVLLAPAAGRRRWGWLGLLALPALAALPLLAWELPRAAAPGPAGYLPVGLGEASAGLLSAFAAGPSGQLPVATLLPAVFVALAGLAGPLLVPTGPSRRRVLVVVAAWLMVPFAGLMLLSLRAPLFSERYLIFLAPAFYLLMAFGIEGLWRSWKPAARIALVACLAVAAAGLWIQATQPIKPDYRAAASRYLAQRQPGDVVLFLIPQGQGPWEELAPAGPDQRYAGAPYAVGPLAASTLDAQMRAAVGAGRRVWLVESEPTLWDPAGRVAGWLALNGRLLTTVDFHLIRLGLYATLEP